MRQKDIRTRVAEMEAEAKCLGTAGEEETEKPISVLQFILGLVMVGIGLYIGISLLNRIGEGGV